MSDEIFFPTKSSFIYKYRLATTTDWLQLDGECSWIVGISSAHHSTEPPVPWAEVYILARARPNDIQTPPPLSLYKPASVSAVKKAICEKLHSGPVPPSSIHFSTNFIFNIKESLSPFKVSCAVFLLCCD